MLHLAKNQGKGVYISRRLINHKQFKKWAKAQGLKVNSNPLHVTVAYSKKPFKILRETNSIIVSCKNMKEIRPLEDANVLSFDSEQFTADWDRCIKKGASWDYDSYDPHMSINYKTPAHTGKIEMPKFNLIFGMEIIEELNNF